MKLMLNGKEVTGMGHYVMAGDIKDATAEDSNVLSGKAYYNNNGKREGTMPNRGGMNVTLDAGGSVSILEGYHNGEGVVRAQDLASQTAGDAGAGNIDSGKTAWVNGVQVTGTSTKVDTSGATATAGDIASGKTAWVNGSKVTGSGKMISPYSGDCYRSNSNYWYVSKANELPSNAYIKVTDGQGYISYTHAFTVVRGNTIKQYAYISSSSSREVQISYNGGSYEISVYCSGYAATLTVEVVLL